MANWKHNVIKNEYWHLSIKFYWKAIAVCHLYCGNLSGFSDSGMETEVGHTDYSAVQLQDFRLWGPGPR